MNFYYKKSFNFHYKKIQISKVCYFFQYLFLNVQFRLFFYVPKSKKKKFFFYVLTYPFIFSIFIHKKISLFTREFSSLSTYLKQTESWKFDSNHSIEAQNCLTSMILRTFISTRCVVVCEIPPRRLTQLLSFDVSYCTWIALDEKQIFFFLKKSL